MTQPENPKANDMPPNGDFANGLTATLAGRTVSTAPNRSRGDADHTLKPEHERLA